MVARDSTSATWWSTLKAILGPQVVPPAVRSPVLADDDAGNALRFIWGDRDAVMSTTEANQKYLGLKLGDIFHSNPLIVGQPAEFPYCGKRALTVVTVSATGPGGRSR